MSTYTSISVIFNPNSSGPSQSLAREFTAELGKAMPSQKVKLVPTKHAGHAEILAYEIAMKSSRPLVIAASGDGGYNEVVNGLMKAQNKGAEPVAGLLPGGNANDHFRNLHDIGLVEAIKHNHEKQIDLLRLTFKSNGKPMQRYAHSYIGFGLTPKVGHRLNKAKLNRAKETWIVLKSLFILEPITLQVDGEIKTYYSLTFNNVGVMSKVMSVSDISKPDDGKFVVTALQYHSKLKLFTTILKASTIGLKRSQKASKYVFTSTKPLLAQLDGEVTRIDAASGVRIDLDHMVLRCII